MTKRSFTLRAVFTALACAGLAASPAQAVNINNDYLDAYYGGILGNYYDSGDTMPNVAAIFLDYQGHGPEQWCTGTLINSRVILTAAHCVANDNAETMHSGIGGLEVRFSPTPATASSPYDRRVRDIVFHSDYFTDDDRDIALISLDRPVHGLDLVQLAPKGYVVDKETLATIVGYGLAGTGTNPGRPSGGSGIPVLDGYNDAKRRIAVTRIGGVRAEGDIIVAEFRDPARPDEYNQYHLDSPVPVNQGEPEGGDSGGPLFIETASGWLQIGTVMRGGGGAYGNAGYGSSDDWTFVPFYSDWIMGNLTALLDGGVESARVNPSAPGVPLRWSDAAAWSGAKVPGNQSGTVDGATGLWNTGTYYNVALDSATHLQVDQNASVDAVSIDHADARLDVLTGQELYTVLNTDVLAGELRVDGGLDSDALNLKGGRLSGTGTIKVADGLLQTGGVLAPGASPGTLTVIGDLSQAAGARFEADIDGPGIASGAGNHDRVLVSGTYTAGGTIAPILRGITGSANNTFTPSLGQGFQVVSAAGGVKGSYAALEQPVGGLPAGTRFDTVYGGTSVTLYATPSAYGNLAAAGVDDNHNRRELGRALDAARPQAGVRAADAGIKQLYDGLAPQTAGNLPVAMDQLGGVGYAQLIQAGFENSKFLVEQTELALAAQRRGDALMPPSRSMAGLEARAGAEPSNPERRAWATAIGRMSSQKADNGGYKTTDTLAGLIGGVQQRLDSGTTVGYSLGYAHGGPDVKSGMGSGRTDNAQLMVYASHALDSGYFMQGTFGAGLGRSKVARHVAVTGASHNGGMNTRNVAASATFGWASGKADEPRFELTAGMRYMAHHYQGFSDSGSRAASALDVSGGTLQSMAATLGAAATVPFSAGSVDWRASAWANVGHEFADRHATMRARLLNVSYEQRSGDIGRDRLAAGLSLSGQMSRRTVLSLGVSGELAKNWKAAGATLGLQVAF
ncbi:autotransporter domain-containing protein [Pollutimonas sp. M17]|uniref:autotransporter domain-containing protein n=1 Tax=Pollutimonas sp. M17 TaxID=2962065 RepID=UPI0021F416A0|nr:autotransporter domain-containing protein [Pollutimonas sp. M17]UYO95054.1 autotransporter domain-containing protein [Pollutimonas sp. M17]